MAQETPKSSEDPVDPVELAELRRANQEKVFAL